MQRDEPAPQRQMIDPKLTRAKAIEQDWRCYYCGCEMLDPNNLGAKGSPVMVALAERLGIKPFSSRWIGKIEHHRLTAEHLVPVIDGGTNDPDNIVAACRFCNSVRGNAPEAQGRADIEELIRVGKHPCLPKPDLK